jgi:hypothetical protein
MKRYIRSTFYRDDFKNIPFNDGEHILFLFKIQDRGGMGNYRFNVVADSTTEAESMFLDYLSNTDTIITPDGDRTSGDRLLRVWEEQKRISTGGFCTLRTEGTTTKDIGVYVLPYHNLWSGSDHLRD